LFLVVVNCCTRAQQQETVAVVELWAALATQYYYEVSELHGTLSNFITDMMERNSCGDRDVHKNLLFVI